MYIGRRIKARRKYLNLTVDDVAAALGKNRSTVYRYENGGIGSLPISILEPLAEVLRTTPEYLLGCANDTSQLDPHIFDIACMMKELKPAQLKLVEDLIANILGAN